MNSRRRSLVLASLCSLLLVPLCQAVEPGFIPLLDRDHTDGWNIVGASDGADTKDGVLSIHPAKPFSGYYWYAKSQFADFTLRLEFKFTSKDGNSGVAVRFNHPGNDARYLGKKNGNYEIDVSDHPDPLQVTGAIMFVKAPSSVPQKMGDWNTLEITAIGQTYAVKVNEQVVNNYVGDRTTSGFIGIQMGRNGIQFRNVRIKDLSASTQQLPISPTAALTLDPNLPLLDTFSQLAPNASAWVLAALDEGVPPNVRQNLTYLREDLLDEYKQKPKASQDAYKLAHQLCSTMINALDERDQTLVRAGFRAVQADANISGTNQALQARRNYMMSWPQYAREQAQRAELIRQGTAGAQVNKALPKVEWSTRTAALRKTLDDLYAQFREALRQSPTAK